LKKLKQEEISEKLFEIENINKEKGQIYVREVCITTNASKFEK